MSKVANEPERSRKNRSSAVEQLARIQEKILQTWETRVRSSVPAAAGKAPHTLRNMMPTLLNNLTTNLSPDSGNFDYQKAGEIGREHGEQRANIGDYTLSQVLYEYRVLRQVIFEILGQEKDPDPNIRNIILNVVDEGIQKAVEQFTVVRLRELEQSNRDLEHFAAIAAHDLKSPLGTISGYVEILSEDLADKIDHDDVEIINSIKKLLSQMTLLVDRLLEYSGSGKKAGSFGPVSTQDVVTQSIEALKSLMEASGAKVVFHDLPLVKGEATLLSQLFQNLISNSIKFRDDRRAPEITIVAKEEPSNWIFSVKDNGIGFRPEDKESLFALFKKIHSKKDHKGYGIGLATARKIVELHGGYIWAESQPGVGSTFFFTLAK